ncbi:FkbM family methyltransferase, partial [bacterium]|nr:FkbM family methyltransferase [bacterium]
QAPLVDFTTVTLGDILERTHAPAMIDFMSLDIEGAELDALKGFPFDRYQIGAMAIEHNYEEPKRTDIATYLKAHGYRRVHSVKQDDFYLPEQR